MPNFSVSQVLQGMAVHMFNFVGAVCILSLASVCDATDEFFVELKPRTAVHVITNTEVTLECDHTYPNIIIPMWEIDGINYRVTDLPLGYEASGANLTFRVYNSTSIRCFFDAFNTSAGEFVVIYSNTINLSADIPDSFVAVEECDPENITLDVLDTEIYISWDIKYYDILDCSFLVTVWNCSHSDTPSFNCTVNASNQRVTRMELNNCLQQSYSYHSGTIIDIKWHDPQCVNDNGCSKDFYMPELFSTVVISRDMDGLFANLSNPYCNTNLVDTTSLLLCFESTSSQDFDGCFDDSLEGNEHFYIGQHSVDNTSWLGVKEIIPSLNGTVISIFCIIERSDNCPQSSYIDTNIFNLEFITNVCGNCSQNATCEDGKCMCKPGYTGDGIRCDPNAMCGSINCSQNATCEDGKCMCKPGYTRNGTECDPNGGSRLNAGAIIGIIMGCIAARCIFSPL